MDNERRRRRSDKWGEAMYFQLDTSRERSMLAGVILLDDDGYSVAEAGDELLLADLHIEVEKLSKNHTSYSGTLTMPTGIQDVYMEAFEIDGNQFYLCAAGGEAEQRKREVQRSQKGIGRILRS